MPHPTAARAGPEWRRAAPIASCCRPRRETPAAPAPQRRTSTARRTMPGLAGAIRRWPGGRLGPGRRLGRFLPRSRGAHAGDGRACFFALLAHAATSGAAGRPAAASRSLAERIRLAEWRRTHRRSRDPAAHRGSSAACAQRLLESASLWSGTLSNGSARDLPSALSGSAPIFRRGAEAMLDRARARPGLARWLKKRRELLERT